MTAVVAFESVCRHFTGRPVLDGLSFEVHEGEVYALLARNGAGKTTALRVLVGMLAPHRGVARVFGEDSSRLDGSMRERIGYVAEDHVLEPARTVTRTLDFEACTRARFDRAWVEERVRALGLPPRKYVGNLSRGQRAQLALLLAVGGRPELLVFDDPALGLDVVVRRELLDAMIDVLSEGGTTVLMTTHAMADVERLADRVGILHDGSLVVDADLDVLRRRVTRVSMPPATGSDWRALPWAERVLAERVTSDERTELVVVDAGEEVHGDPRPLDLEELFVALTTAREVEEAMS